MKILVIEDDEIVARTIERSLRGNDFSITVTNSGIEGLKSARRLVPDLVLLDIIMPGMDGYTVCKEMRADTVTAEIPILFLSAKAKDEDRIAGFMAGADDYLVKPFNIDELVLRIRAILRRVKKQNKQISLEDGLGRPDGHIAENPEPTNGQTILDGKIDLGDYILNIRTFELDTPCKGTIRLTPVQFDLLYHLMSHPGEIYSPGRLLYEVWGYPSDTGSPDLVRVHVKNLRERVESDPKDPKFIQTIAGYGYTVMPKSE